MGGQFYLERKTCVTNKKRKKKRKRHSNQKKWWKRKGERVTKNIMRHYHNEYSHNMIIKYGSIVISSHFVSNLYSFKGLVVSFFC